MTIDQLTHIFHLFYLLKQITHEKNICLYLYRSY